MLLQYESARVREFNQREYASAQKVRRAREARNETMSAGTGKHAGLEIPETESSSDEVQETSPPLPPMRRPTRRPIRKTADMICLRDSPVFSARKNRKIKLETPEWDTHPSTYGETDSKAPLSYSTTNRLISIAGLSELPEYMQTPESAIRAAASRKKAAIAVPTPYRSQKHTGWIR
ncbi:MAG: hypothetical protein L6R40_008017 [Gallowayella cf. fulva]|nr:MAG: hypothetical protein L6R40_008017 [Xanthomendoza cf. fulva]